MKRTIVVSVLVAFMVAGCASAVKCSMAEGLQGVTYCLGKVSGDGQEAVFRDAWQGDKPVLSSFGSGPSLWGQSLQGVAGDAALAGGMVGAAALLRPTRINNHETNNLDNGQVQIQGQLQGQQQGQSATAGATSTSSSKATNNNSNTNTNTNITKVKVHDVGGSGGGVPGCQKAKNGCDD